MKVPVDPAVKITCKIMSEHRRNADHLFSEYGDSSPSAKSTGENKVHTCPIDNQAVSFLHKTSQETPSVVDAWHGGY